MGKDRRLRRGKKFYKALSWSERVNAFADVARLIETLPCRITAVQVDTRDLPEYIETDSDLYRLAFWRLLDELETNLSIQNELGLMMADARSDLHSSVQDRRLIDAFREWVGSRSGRTHFVEPPWFGFSAFYGGLQLADFAAYFVDFVSNELERAERDSELAASFRIIEKKIDLIRIP